MSSGEVGDGWAVPNRAVRAGLNSAARSATAPAHAPRPAFYGGSHADGVIPFS
jgi:hypothetical protein